MLSATVSFADSPLGEPPIHATCAGAFPGMFVRIVYTPRHPFSTRDGQREELSSPPVYPTVVVALALVEVGRSLVRLLLYVPPDGTGCHCVHNRFTSATSFASIGTRSRTG